MARLKINLLGSFRIYLEEALITNFESNKVRALLAYLAVESWDSHNREKLSTLFWPEMSAKRASSNLSQALYSLRQLLQDHQATPPFLLHSRDSIQFNRESDYWLDVEQFNQNLIQDQTLAPFNDGYHENMQRAIDLYRGDFLDGLSFDSSLNFDEWMLVQRQRFQRQALDGLHQLAAFYAATKALPKALPLAWRQVELDPLDERACRQLMQLLAANDQRSQALTQFERLQVMLAEELGVNPEPLTLAFRNQIREKDRASSQAKSVTDNLPAFITPLIGRQKELGKLQALIENGTCRLLTILGPGGGGKTRLALEVARNSQKIFNHGVYFVPLNPVQSPESILPAIADAIELPRGEKDDIKIQLINYLRKKNVLLLLDGFEHLLEGTHLLVEILHQTSRLKILVTSRSLLNIKGEHLYPLGGMCYPDDVSSEIEIQESDAIQLLLSGLQRVCHGYIPNPSDARYLLQICQQVQGIPLGILLAASWGAVLSLKEIAESVRRSLDFLSADWIDLPSRQRSMRATFDHTWNLLNIHEQNCFQSLSVFRGAFSRRAAREVSGASPYELRALVERSLLWNKTPGWYEMHELLRQYGREKLAQSSAIEQEICSKHSEYYLKTLATLGDDLKNAQQVATLSRIDLVHENCRAAWNWTVNQGAIAQVTPVVDALCLYYDLSLRHPDGESVCRTALDSLQSESDDPELRLLQARLLTWQSRFTRLLGRSEMASQLLDKAQVHLGGVKSVGDQVRNMEAFIALERGNIYFNNDRSAATNYYERSLKINRKLGNDWGTAKALARLGSVAHHAGSFEKAVDIYAECLDLNQKLGDPRGIANALIELGHNSLRQGEVETGQEYIQDGISILQQIGDRAGTARGYLELGRSCFWTGEFSKGDSLMMKSIPILEDLGMWERMVFSTTALSLGLSHEGKYEDAISQATKGLSLAKEMNARREIALAHFLIGKAYLGQRKFERSLESLQKSVIRYQKIDQKDELSWALALIFFARRGLNQPLDMDENLVSVLRISMEIQGYFPVLCSLCGFALHCLDQGDIQIAVELIATIGCYPVVAKSAWFEDIAGREIALAAEVLPAEVILAAQKRGWVRDIWGTAKELLVEISPEPV